MPDSYILIRRRPYEEPRHIHLEVAVSNGVFCGAVDIYVNPGEIAEFGSSLVSFPRGVPGESVFEYGTADPAARFYRHFALRAYTVDSVGGCALRATIDLNEEDPQQASCQFSMLVDPMGLNRLGQLLVRFSELEHVELSWTPAGGELHTRYSLDGPNCK